MLQRLLDAPTTPRRLLLALAVFAAALEFFVYFGLGGARRDTAEAILALAQMVKDEDAPLARRLHKLNAAHAAEGEAPADPNWFLKHIDAAAGRTGVQLSRVVPRLKKEGTVDVEIVSRYGDFVRFVADIESLGATLADLQISASEGPRAEVQHATFVLESPKQPRRRPPGETFDYKPERNPFAAFAAAPAQGPTEIDRNYKLTGITRLPDGYMATIDGRDYQRGDTFQRWTVEAIDETSVVFSAGTERSILRMKGMPQ